MDADVSCDDDDIIVTWLVYDPADDWSSGWQMVIDSDNRGVFSPGTIVTNQGGPAVADEEVDPGTYTLTIDVHWERLPQGDRDRQFGTFSITADANLECEDD